MDVVSTIMEMGSGAVAEQLNEEWAELRRAVLSAGGTGELTIKLKLKATGVNKAGAVSQVEIGHTTSIKKPKLKTGASFFFVTPEGNLTRKDQRQQELEMEFEPGTRKEVR